jgi:hypothetical protein
MALFSIIDRRDLCIGSASDFGQDGNRAAEPHAAGPAGPSGRGDLHCQAGILWFLSVIGVAMGLWSVVCGPWSVGSGA